MDVSCSKCPAMPDRDDVWYSTCCQSCTATCLALVLPTCIRDQALRCKDGASQPFYFLLQGRSALAASYMQHLELSTSCCASPAGPSRTSSSRSWGSCCKVAVAIPHCRCFPLFLQSILQALLLTVSLAGLPFSQSHRLQGMLISKIIFLSIFLSKSSYDH